MKKRNGFVTNSSSSSFIINKSSIIKSAEELRLYINNKIKKYSKNNNYNLSEDSYIIIATKDAKLIKKSYEEFCFWDADSLIQENGYCFKEYKENFDKEETFLSLSLKSDFTILTEDNAFPYDMMEEITKEIPNVVFNMYHMG